jgi:hypothetical protein
LSNTSFVFAVQVNAPLSTWNRSGGSPPSQAAKGKINSVSKAACSTPIAKGYAARSGRFNLAVAMRTISIWLCGAEDEWKGGLQGNSSVAADIVLMLA